MTEHKKSWIARHKILAIMGIVVLLGIIGGVIGGNKDQNDITRTSSTSTTTKDEKAKTEYKINETATSDDKSITVTEIQRNYQTGNQFAQPESGKEFVLVTIEITNNSKSNMDYSTFEFKMQDSNGVQQNEAITALSQGKLNSGSLAPGGKVTGKLAYEVPTGDTGLKLLYQTFSWFDNKPVTFVLQ